MSSLEDSVVVNYRYSAGLHIDTALKRSQLEQSSVVWHSSLTEQQKNDLERVQKSALKIILGPKYESYKKALETLDLEPLDQRRGYL